MRWFGPRAQLSAEDEQRQQRSWAELEAGRLPLSAQERLASQVDEKVFTSALSTRDLVAVRAAGYEPVGQAFGTAVYRVTRQTGYFPVGVHPNVYNPTGARLLSPRWGGPAAEPNTDRPHLVSGFFQAEVQARSTAMRRLEAEARALGADGVIGVRVLPGEAIEGCVQFSLYGTAVRSTLHRPQGAVERLFTTTLAASDFGQLLRGGWAPTGILFELARYAAHAGYPAYGGGGMNPLNYQAGELAAASTMLDAVRGRARETLISQVRKHGGTGMIMDSFDTALHHYECQVYEAATDYLATVSAVGNAIVAVSPRRASDPASGLASALASGLAITPVIRLDREGNREF